MAEFREVLRQIKRYCDAQTACKKCELFKVVGEMCPSDLFAEDNGAGIETMVMSWAEDHPDQTYPTWGEWLESEGICFSRLKNYSRVAGMSIPQVFEYQIDGETAFICGDKVNSPIPADIAEKLGIEPKEV